ncbi:MAG TPA: metalloregulator ArsR/SmtB family transcription factor [Anaerovoracaceae bacterium]|nr:metalloregulator ArsR/SmtB family transcription factor [Anaerovoracaceae bacterium]
MNQLTSIFKILSDETRVRIIILLYQEELCVCELSGILDVPQSRISKNLSRLRDLNLVVDERKEKFVFYKLRRENKLFLNTIENIMKDFGSYSQLVTDKNRLSSKEDYLNQCVTGTCQYS